MRRILLTTFAAVMGASWLATPSLAALPEPEYRQIHFPVEGAVSFHDDFGDPRSGGRSHAGNDLMGQKLQRLLAAVDGTVSYMRLDSGGLSGNMLTLRDRDGWTYRYIHINNDSPGTDDGLNPPEWAFAPGIQVGTRVRAGDHLAFLGDSGNAEDTGAHLHFEMVRPDRTPISPWTSLRLAQGLPAGNRCSYGTNPAPTPLARSGRGYHVLGVDGGIFTFGDTDFHGSVPGLGLATSVTALRLSATPSGEGYWILGDDGGIFTFGDADFHGSVPGLGLPRLVRAIDLRPTPSGDGYWILGDDGGIFTFGDADFHGSVPGLGLGAAVRALRLVPTSSGDGYWVLGADGGVFSFGDADFHGSVPGLGLPTRPVKAMAAAPNSDGYWVLGEDGGVFTFGSSRFYGSVPGAGLCQWPEGAQLAASATGLGYWVAGQNGAVWAFGDAVDHGDLPTVGVTDARAVDLTVVPPRRR